MQDLVQTNLPGYYRDMKTGAILNKNISELNKYMMERDRAEKQEEINKKVDELSEAVSEIKEILKFLAKQKNG
jgi:C4-dicarboxylate-specific signal transduction histidine kinase